MGLEEIIYKEQYVTGEDDLISDFYIPCLSKSIYYDRAAGFFNSSIYHRIKMGLEPFVKNGGRMRLLTSAKLTPADINKIKQGYDERQWLEEHLNSLYEDFYKNRSDYNVANLCWLIKCGRLDIKISLPDVNLIDYDNDSGIFHDKIGIFTDDKEQFVVFFGSNNESIGGWVSNFESFEVYCSWDQGVSTRALKRKHYFERLWNGVIPSIKTYDFPEAFKEKLIQIAPPKFHYEDKRFSSDDNGFEPRKCQKEALDKFLANNYVCLYQMATGTGKTKAAVYSMHQIKENWDFLVILVPSVDLVRQWQKDVKLFFPEDYIIMCGSNWVGWKTEFRDLIEARIPFRTILISTYDSAKTDFTLSNLQLIDPGRVALICDEVHNLGATGTKVIMEKIKPRYRIGLSATPNRHFDDEGSELILQYFNNVRHEVSIKEAIRDKYLVEYEYYVLPVMLNASEWEDYVELSNQISKLRFIVDDEKSVATHSNLNRLLERRAKILKTAESKLLELPKILSNINNSQRTLIYGDTIDHLEEFGKCLDEMGKEYFMYIGRMDSAEVRPRMIEDFELGIRKFMLAVKCLDEGVDIPTCDTAIFVSSSTSTREFVQRRGRVLRKGYKKTRAFLYDFIVIPPYNPNNERETELAVGLIAKEYQRIIIMAEDAINGTRTIATLDEYLTTQGLNPYSL